jgi:signal transduction histidine kinase
MNQEISRYLRAIEAIHQGNYDLDFLEVEEQFEKASDKYDRLAHGLADLAAELKARNAFQEKLEKIILRANAGFLLENILECIYQDFQTLIPYNRMGLATLEKNGMVVRSVWAKSDHEPLELGVGYSAKLENSSLASILETGQPRILNDLVEYLGKKPNSASTRLMVKEGIRSSLTCPLIANRSAVGFLFFSSTQAGTYADVHVETFLRIADQLSVILEKGRLASALEASKTEIEQKNEELRHLNELKNNFLGIAAHDLRSPLSFIRTSSDLLLNGAKLDLENAEQLSLLENINRQSQYLLGLLDDLLDLTEIEAGKMKLTLQEMDAGSFFPESLKAMFRLADAKGMKVILEAPEQGKMKGDPARLRQVIENLVSNAIKYAPPGSTVRVVAREEPGAWQVSVQDEGPGLTEEDRQRVFQSFARLSALPTGGEKSTGLGLAIVRWIVEAHGGKVGVDSQLSQGSTFWFTLPKTKEHS